jgi:hypothetical protein
MITLPPTLAEVHPMPNYLERRLFFLLIATLVWSSAMLLEANGILSPDFRAPSGCYFTGKPIVDAELAQTTACFRSIVTPSAEEGHDNNVSLVRANTYMDFLFIVLYCAIFVTFAQIENGWSSTLASLLICVEVEAGAATLMAPDDTAEEGDWRRLGRVSRQSDALGRRSDQAWLQF